MPYHPTVMLHLFVRRSYPPISSLHKILDPNISLIHEQCEETNGHTRDSTKNYPIYELIEFIPLDGQAKENSKHAAERSSRLLQVGLVLIVG